MSEIKLEIYKGREGVREFKPHQVKKCPSVLFAQEYISDNALEYYVLKQDNKIIAKKGACSIEKGEIIITNAALVITHLETEIGVTFKTWFELHKGSGEIAVYFSERESALATHNYLTKHAKEFSILEVIKQSLCLSFRTLTPTFNELLQWETRTQKALPETPKSILNLQRIAAKYASFSWETLLATPA